MIEDFIDNEKLLKLYKLEQYRKNYRILNKDKIKKISNDLYHNKYKKDETFLHRVSLQKKRNIEEMKI